MQQRMNLITLGVQDLAESIRFYELGLEWVRSSASQANIVFFPLNGIVLCLYPVILLAEDAGVDPFRKGFSGITLSYNAESEAEVDRIIAKIDRIGAEIVKRPQKVAWGGYSSYFKDPDGYLFEVAYNPYFEMDNQGSLILP